MLPVQLPRFLAARANATLVHIALPKLDRARNDNSFGFVTEETYGFSA